MEGGALIVRLALAAVFAAAAAAKLASPSETRRSLAGFGVPGRLAPAAAIAVPLAEAITAGLLLLTPTATAGALAALSLLVLFTIAVAVNLLRGRRPDCGCFGATRAAPIGAGTVARNAVLAAGAALVALAGPGDAGAIADWLGNPSPAGWIAIGLGVLALGAIATEGWLIVSLIAQNGRLLERVDALERGAPPSGARRGLSPGERVPDFALPALTGEPVSLASLLTPGVPVALVFSHPECGPCREIAPRLGDWQRERAGELAIAVLLPSGEAPPETPFVPRLTLLSEDDSLFTALGMPGYPSAALLDPDGTLVATAMGPVEVERLVAKEAASLHQVLRIGAADEVAHA